MGWGGREVVLVDLFSGTNVWEGLMGPPRFDCVMSVVSKRLLLSERDL